MVDVSEKSVTSRRALAAGHVKMSEAVLAKVRSGENKKGHVQSVAELAGIMGGICDLPNDLRYAQSGR